MTSHAHRRTRAAAPGRASAASLLACGVLCAAFATPALAAPEAARSDALQQWLEVRGLVSDASGTVAASSAALAQRARDAASELVLSAMSLLDVRYRRGGNTAEEGFDCSGFTRHVFERTLGLVLPRRADEQARLAALRQVEREELRPGDLVFFNTMRRAFSHVGIYVGEGRFIHAPRSGAQVRVEDMRQAYWRQRYDGARRAAAADDGAPTPAAAVDAASPPR